MLPLHNYRSSYATGSVGVICKYGSYQYLIFYREAANLEEQWRNGGVSGFQVTEGRREP